MPTRPSADLWRQLAAEAGEDAIERAANTSVAEASRELHEAGFDVTRERAEGVALLDAMEKRAAPKERAANVTADAAPESAPDTGRDAVAWVTKAEPTRTGSRAARWPWLLAATLALAAGGGVLYALGHRSKPIENPLEVPSVGPIIVNSAGPTNGPSTAPIIVNSTARVPPPASPQREVGGK